MEISEVEPEKKIVISKVDFVCDMLDDSIPKPLFQNYNHFLILSVCASMVRCITENLVKYMS